MNDADTATQTDQVFGLIGDVFAEPPPPETKARVMAAVAARPSQRVSLGPIDVLSTVIDGVGNVLATLSPGEWDAPALGDLDVKHVVAHLHGADEYLGAGIGLWDGITLEDELDHRAASQAQIDEATALTAAEVTAQWRGGADALLGALRSLPAERLEQPAKYHIFQSALGSVLIARSFEVWTHGDDICRATERPLVPPPAAALAAMTQAGTGLVPLTYQLRNGPSASTVRVVLTGDGGGTWTFPLGPGAPDEPDATVVTDAISFCRLVANRVAFDELECEIEGDRQLAAAALAGVSMLALD